MKRKLCQIITFGFHGFDFTLVDTISNNFEDTLYAALHSNNKLDRMESVIKARTENLERLLNKECCFCKMKFGEFAWLNPI